jgi:hypothetical protein
MDGYVVLLWWPITRANITTLKAWAYCIARGVSVLVPHRLFKLFNLLVTAALAATAVGVTASPAAAFVPQSGDRFVWASQAAGYCMGVAGGDMTSGTSVIQWDCNGNADQTWIAERVGPSYTDGSADFRIRNAANPNECLSVAENKTYVWGQPLVIWQCKPLSTYDDQIWNLQSGQYSDACTRFVSRESLDVYKELDDMAILGFDYGTRGARLGLHIGQGIDLGLEWCAEPAPSS